MLRLLRFLPYLLATIILTASAAASAAGPKVVSLRSGNEVTVPLQDEVVLDQETLDELTTASYGRPDPRVEAIWFAAAGDIYLRFERSGYVTMDDWAEIDVDELWDSYVEGSREQSKDFGYEVTPLEWVIEPTLLREEAVAFYALSIKFGDDDPVVNLVIFDLGRHGYEEMTYIQYLADFQVDRARDVALGFAIAHDYKSGARYADFQSGDMVAAVGIGAVIASSLGSNTGKGVLAAIAAFFVAAGKKLLFLLLVPVYFVWNFVKRSFGRSEE